MSSLQAESGRSRRPRWAIALAVGIFAVLVALAWVIGWLAGEPVAGAPVGQVSPSAVSPSPVVAPARVELTARSVVDRLAERYPVTNMRVNTGYGANAGVVEAVTTDAVTVLRFDSEEHAQAWVDGFTKSGVADVRRVGVFVLSWTSSGEQDLTSEEARAAWLAEVRRLVAGA